MGDLALYRKYRSQDFNDLVGQDHVSRNLQAAVERGQVGHAYLFSGPRGVGKTSAARILAAKVNGLEKAADSVDIIEIDAASNNGVDEIRDLREKIQVAPNYSQYKVYIIDEVHMLSSAAFNALLKTLEEPPAHVIFILATTEAHKLPATIISRTQHFIFRPVGRQDITAHLQKIAAAEKLELEAAAAELIAGHAGGSLRDGLSLLDQLGSGGQPIDSAAVGLLLGLAPQERLQELLEALAQSDNQALLKSYDALLGSGIAPEQLVKQLISLARDILRGNRNVPQLQTTAQALLAALSTLPTQTMHLEAAIEAQLLKLCQRSNPIGATAPPVAAVVIPKKSAPKSQSKTPSEPEKAEVATKKPVATVLNNTAWVKTLSLIKQRNNGLASLLRNCEVSLAETAVTIECRFQFHYRYLQQPAHFQLVGETLARVCGQQVTVNLTAKQQPAPAVDVEADEPQEDDNVTNQVVALLGGEIL